MLFIISMLVICIIGLMVLCISYKRENTELIEKKEELESQRDNTLEAYDDILHKIHKAKKNFSYEAIGLAGMRDKHPQLTLAAIEELEAYCELEKAMYKAYKRIDEDY